MRTHYSNLIVSNFKIILISVIKSIQFNLENNVTFEDEFATVYEVEQVLI